MVEHPLEGYDTIDRDWTDRFAAARTWEDFDMGDPVQDLYLFRSFLDRQEIVFPTLLDAGCGWGRYIWRFTRCDYTGIDHSDEMLKVAREDERNNRPHIKFVSGTTSAMPFENHSFDGIWSCCALAGVPMRHLVEVLEEHRRVLRPTGIMTVVMADSLWDEEGVSHTKFGDMYHSQYTLETFLTYIKQTGFEILDYINRHGEGSYTVTVRNPA